jgi:hypothetical protein
LGENHIGLVPIEGVLRERSGLLGDVTGRLLRRSGGADAPQGRQRRRPAITISARGNRDRDRVGLGYFLLARRFAFFAGFFFAAFFFAAMCAPLRCAVSLVAARRGGGLWCGGVIGDPAPR